MHDSKNSAPMSVAELVIGKTSKELKEDGHDLRDLTDDILRRPEFEWTRLESVDALRAKIAEYIDTPVGVKISGANILIIVGSLDSGICDQLKVKGRDHFAWTSRPNVFVFI